MAESDGGQEKTEQPSSRRLQQARDKGQVARSRELTSFSVVIVGTLLMVALGPQLIARIFSVTTDLFSISREVLLNENEVAQLFLFSVKQIVLSLSPLFFGFFCVGIVSSVILGGIGFSVQALQPQWSRMNPIAGFKRMFSSKALIELIKALAKFLLVAGVAILVIYYKVPALLALSFSTTEQASINSVWIMVETFLWMGASLIIVVMMDVPYQLWQHNSQLKMTKQEVKDEYKETEGKPEVKSRIRQMQREIAQRRMMDKVPEADIVITNPQHYAVALRYKSAQDEAPILLAKGKNLIAFKIREIADEHNVHILAAPPLARAVYHSTKLNQSIPAGLYLAVAQALAYVYQLNQYQKGLRKQPVTKPEFPIPEDYRKDDE